MHEGMAADICSANAGKIELFCCDDVPTRSAASTLQVAADQPVP